MRRRAGPNQRRKEGTVKTVKHGTSENRTCFVAVAAAALLFASAAGDAFAQSFGVTEGSRIVNGVASSGDASTGALLTVGDEAGPPEFVCTAVLIGCHTVLTAAQCVCPAAADSDECVGDLPDPATLRVFFASGGLFTIRDIAVSPKYKRGVRGDLAVLTIGAFDPNGSQDDDGGSGSPLPQKKVTGITPASINLDGTPGRFFTGKLVGYGVTAFDLKDNGIKRLGDVFLNSCPARVASPANICWDFEEPLGSPGTDSTGCTGDQGGPLFVDLGSGASVVGVFSDNSPPPVTFPHRSPEIGPCEPGVTGYATNVFKNRAFIQRVGGDDLLKEQCGDTPPVGSDDVFTFVVTDMLKRKELQQRLSFPVPSRTFEVRVSLSGSNNRNGDLDMFVAFDRPPTKGDNDCKVADPGFFGTCTFTEVPEDVENVQVLLQHVRLGQGRGKSNYQVTVTFFRAPGDGEIPDEPTRLEFRNRGNTRRILEWRDNSDNEEGFLLQRQVGNPFNDFVDHAITGENQSAFLDRVEPDLIYSYRVRAFNENGVSRPSNICRTDIEPPVRPLRLRAAEIKRRSILLTWRDRSDSETGFQIQRRLTGEKRFETIVVVGQNVTQYRDDTLKPGTSYDYRVRANGGLVNCIPNSIYAPKQTFETLP